MSTFHRWIGPAIILFPAFILWGCDVAVPTPVEQRPTLTASAETAQETPATAPEQQQYTSPDFGFSLAYPAGFEVQQSFPHSILFLAPQGTPGHRERGWLAVERASEESAGWYADQVKQQNANLGIEITSSVQTLDGQQAHILGGLPGQDLNRQVFIVHNGILYHLTFVPDDPASAEEYRQMEDLYAAVIGSLRFLPERTAVPPVTDISNMMRHLERALNGRREQEIALLLGDDFVLGSLSPATAEGVTFSRHARTEAVPLILKDHLSQAPAVTLQYQVDWASVPGSLDTYSAYFPGEDVTPILARGWGPSGDGEAVIIIARRMDSSLLWRGAFLLE